MLEFVNESKNFDIKVVSRKDEVEEEIARKIPLALALIGEEIEGKAKRNCPVDTGYLRNSITYALAGETTKISEYKADRAKVESEGVRHGTYSGVMPEETGGTYAVYIGSNVEYAAAVEMRDVNHKVGKAHFIRDAADKSKSRIKKIIETVLSEE